MSEWAIAFDHVWKSFPLRKDRPGFKEFMVHFHRYLRGKDRENHRFYALKDLTFQIKRGECLGIIGRNGAGKTTLLSLMLKTILPSRGEVRVWDRITPLLELGSGFHPDLTGRENVILNGVLLDFTKKEILDRMPSIIDFSEIGDFIDLPIRTYSTGMYLRLAFSVAVHTDPRIFLIDEILSVGDEGFQKKSKEAMLRLIRSGVTTVFVSHNLQAIREVSHRVIWLDHGEVVAEGEPGMIIERYREG